MKTRKLLSLLIVTILCVTLFAACEAQPQTEQKTQTLQLDGGYTYVGEVENGQPNGQGTLTDELGSEWKGTFVGGKLNGYGTYIGYDLVEYEGTFKDGKFDGMGVENYANGDVYMGEFKEGIPEGVGRMEFTTGCFYEGGWKNGNMEGLGWMTWPVGDAYFGEWEGGVPKGFGCKIFFDPSIASCRKGDYTTYNKYVGEMVNNLPNGMGIMFFQASGGIFYGNFENGIRNDNHGVYYFEKGVEFVKFEGSFSAQMNNGWIWGEGTMWYSDGTVVTGTWEGTECVNVTSTTQVNLNSVVQEIDTALQTFNENPILEQTLTFLG